MSHILIHDKELAHYRELTVQNYMLDGLVRFKNKARKPALVNELIIHETVTRSAADTVLVLNQRKLGVHFIVDEEGIVRQHADLLDDEMWHASQHNGLSVGIEVVNPYYPRFMPAKGPWNQVIPAPWAHEGRYCLPTREQAEATAQLTMWLTSSNAEGLDIPRTWIGIREEAKTLSMGPFESAKKSAPGIYAHHYFGHMDGAWLVLYSWLRIEGAMGPEAAYLEAIRLGTGARTSVDVAARFPTEPVIRLDEDEDDII